MGSVSIQGLAKAKATLSRIAQEANVFREDHPTVKGLSKFCNRITKGSNGERKDWPKTVEIDVVAQDGSLWIEVKDTEWFGIGSSRWLGKSSNSAGVRTQAVYQAHAAKQPVNARRWEAPQLVYHFPSGVDTNIEAELQNLGIIVSCGSSIDISKLPAPPLPAAATNLDVTALCALCSEVPNGDVYSPEITAWMGERPHLQACVAAEKQEPLLPQLEPLLIPGRPVYAAESAVSQFRILLGMFGGPREKMRWAGWSQRIQVVSSGCKPSGRIQALAVSHCMTEAQREIFNVGDCMRAITITANGHALQSAASQGVQIEAFKHPAMWLTGF